MTIDTKLKKTFISQSDNYNGNFGEVLRSSAIFWVKNNSEMSTIISFSNYWKYKNFIDVSVFVNTRELTGKLLHRKSVSFVNGFVFNYRPPENFEGSVEVEVFSIKNMRIPYAAIMAVYETKHSISMVHSYTRVYSQHEIEEGRTIMNGQESCWTLRDTKLRTSFSVIHNGSVTQPHQNITISIRNWTGKEQSKQIELKALSPFETIIIEPKKYFDNLIDFLEGKPGNARLAFKLNGAFTRMLCGIKTVDETQLQVTHSNFDYSIHDTDKITKGVLKAYMRTPNVNSDHVKQEILVYPDTHPGDYVVEYENKIDNFSTGEIYQLPFDTHEERLLTFSRTDDILPTRIVTALRLNTDDSIIPAECSLGVVHHARPKKHFHWMLVSKKFNSQISWVDFKEVYGGCPEDAEFVFKLYSPENSKEIVSKFLKLELPKNNMVYLSELFNTHDINNDYCYLTLWCSYGGLEMFSTLEKLKSITIEHAF